MSALDWMKSTGVELGLTPDGGLELDGLERLDDDLYARVLEVARSHKAELVEWLRVETREFSLEALAKFERDPVGVVSWLGQQPEGQPAHLVPRWAACVRAEARQRLLQADSEVED